LEFVDRNYALIMSHLKKVGGHFQSVESVNGHRARRLKPFTESVRRKSRKAGPATLICN
jgi:hypothetical protein